MITTGMIIAFAIGIFFGLMLAEVIDGQGGKI